MFLLKLSAKQWAGTRMYNYHTSTIPHWACHSVRSGPWSSTHPLINHYSYGEIANFYKMWFSQPIHFARYMFHIFWWRLPSVSAHVAGTWRCRQSFGSDSSKVQKYISTRTSDRKSAGTNWWVNLSYSCGCCWLIIVISILRWWQLPSHDSQQHVWNCANNFTLKQR